jgi:uncharacterized protein
MKNNIFKVIFILLLSIILLGAPRLARLIANLFETEALDPDRSFLWLSIRHLIQLIIVLLIMFVISKFKKIDFHLGFGNKEIGISYLKKFMLFFSIYTVGAFLLIILTGGFQSFPFPLVPRNIIGYLGFQLLLTGPSEEIIFRAFAITMFGLLFSNRVFKGKISAANLYAAIIFGIAHIYIAFSPFEISYSIMQVFLAIGLGIFYGDCYEKSKSVIYPIIMHSFTNVLMVGITIILSFLL